MARLGTIGRPRRWPLLVLGAIVLVVIAFVVLSHFYIDMLWYREVDLSTVFWTEIRTKVLLGLVFGALFFALLYVNLLIVRWITPETRVLTPDQEVVERFRMTVEPSLRWMLPLGSAVLALLVALGASHQWQTFLLWRSSSGITFGNPDPLFGRDPAFYVFSLPWLRFVQGWLFSSFVGVTFLAGLGHYLWGGIRPQAPQWADKVTAPVRAHLSVLLGIIMLIKAWGYWLGRFDLLASPRGTVQGASYTDVNAQLPALNFLAIVAVICAVLFLVNIRVRMWSLPVIAVGLLALVSVLLGAAYPTFVQQFRVKPQELQREAPYIKDNIDGTRTAFGLDSIQVTPHPAQPFVTGAEVDANQTTVSNIRLWRQGVLQENFRSLQRIKQYYDFQDVDVDRYLVNSDERVLMLAAREVSQDQIPGTGGTWQNKHLVYTHGYGAVASQVNTASPEGAPVFTLQDLPPVGQPQITQPRVYYGEREDVPFVVTNTGASELDFEGATTAQQYTGKGGIPAGNIFQRALFALRYQDVNLLISGLITPDSRIMINRDIASRTHLPAPFLTFDKDPYMAVVDGRIVWIWDAYTTTSEYPYSQSVNLADATGGDIAGNVNYMRNSVKVVVDAYDGTMTYYADLENDPIIRAWSVAFPGMFTPIGDAPTDLSAHFRYPENLFQVQAQQFAKYHVTDPSDFYNSRNLWAIPHDPTYCPNTPGAFVCQGDGGSIPALRPTYQLLKLPDSPQEEFVLMLPFVPDKRQNMVAWMVARSDPANYGQLTAYTVPVDTNVEGPELVFSRINQDREFSSERSLLSTGGSAVIFGDFLTVPVGDSYLYVQPVYVRSNQENAIPELKRVVVVNGGTVGVGDNLPDALALASGGEVTPPNQGGGQGATVSDLLSQALDHFAAADQALKNGNLATYQSELKLAQSLVQQANDLAKSQGGSGSSSTPGATGTSPSPSTSASPSASPTG